MPCKVKYIHPFVKGLTLIEVLVTLALTSIVVTLAYTGLNYIQKLYTNYQQQTRFINSFAHFKSRMEGEGLKSKYILETAPSEYRIQRDSDVVELKVLPKTIITIHQSVTDTFYLEAKNLKAVYQPINNTQYAGKLVQQLNFECSYTKQKFNFYFRKTYDAATLLELEDITLEKNQWLK